MIIQNASADSLFRLGFPLAVVLLFWLFAWVKLRPQWLRSLLSANWPVAFGTIEDGNVSVVRSERGELAVCTLNYSYSVEGSYYGGNYLQRFSDEQAAYDYISSKRGKSAQVRYNPRNPQTSVLTLSNNLDEGPPALS
jgi:hypothetical protein